MALSFSQLLSPMTSDPIRASLVTSLKALGVPADQWRPGGTFSTLLTAASLAGAMFSSLFATVIGSGMLVTAQQGWLAWVAQYQYGVIVGGATFATGSVTFVNTGGGIYNFAVGQVIVQNVRTKATFTNTQPLSLGASGSSTATATISMQATVAGSGGNSNPGELSVLQTSLPGVTVSNPNALIGLDAPAPADVVALCLARLGVLSPGGAQGAYLWAARTALNGGTPVAINRVQIFLNPATGITTVYCASASGPATASDVAAAQNNILVMAVADGATPIVQSATAVADTQTLTVYCLQAQGLDTSVVQTNVLNALAVFLSTYPIGGVAKGPNLTKALWATAIDGVVKGADPSIVAVDGATDLVLSQGQVATSNFVVNVLVTQG